MGCKGESAFHIVDCTTFTLASHTRRLHTDCPSERSTGGVQKTHASLRHSSPNTYDPACLLSSWQPGLAIARAEGMRLCGMCPYRSFACLKKLTHQCHLGKRQTPQGCMRKGN